MQMAINVAAKDGTVIDYKDNSLEVITGSSSKIDFNLDGDNGELIRVEGNAKLGIADFFEIEGSFGFEKSTGTYKVGNNDVKVDQMLIGVSNLDAFVGINGGTPDALGIDLIGVEVGVAIPTEQAAAKRTWVAVEANATTANLVGVDGITLNLSDLSVEVNLEASDGTVVDF